MEEPAKTIPPDTNLPPDANLIKQIGSMGIYFSKSEYCLFLEVTDYHSGLVRLSEEDLLSFISVMNKNTEDIEQEILSEIEDDDLTNKLQDIISKDKSRERFRGAKIRLVFSENDGK